MINNVFYFEERIIFGNTLYIRDIKSRKSLILQMKNNMRPTDKLPGVFEIDALVYSVANYCLGLVPFGGVSNCLVTF